MDSKLSSDGIPIDGKAALLTEVEAALALVGLARVSGKRDTIRRLHENTKLSYERVLVLLPAGVRTMTAEEEDALWVRIDPIRQWLEATAWLCLSSDGV